MAKKDTGADNIDPSQVVEKSIIKGIPEREKKTDHIIISGASGYGKSREAYRLVCQYFPKRTVVIDPLSSWHIRTSDLPPGINPKIKVFGTLRGLLLALDDKNKRIIQAELIARKTGKKVPPNMYYFIYVLKNESPNRLMMEFLRAKLFEIGHVCLVEDEMSGYVDKHVKETKCFYRQDAEFGSIMKMPSLWNDVLRGGRHACLTTIEISQEFSDFPVDLRKLASSMTIFRQSSEGAAAAIAYIPSVDREKYGKNGEGLEKLGDGESVKIWRRPRQSYDSSQMAPGYRY